MGSMNEQALYALLLRRLGEEGMSGTAGIAVAELHRRLIPYPSARESLGFTTKAEYDVALLRLLADETLVALDERGLRESVRRELASPEPGLGLLHRFAASELRLVGAEGSGPAAGLPSPSRSPAQIDLETERRATDRVPGLDDLELVPEPAGPRASTLPDAPAGPDPEAAAARPSGAPSGAATCRDCRKPLPGREGARFCPHCGADQSRRSCAACGADVERGWRYCAMCGTLQPH